VLIFGTLYLISPKTYPVDPPLRPVPWALSIYLALTLLRIVWARFGRLPDWAVLISIVLDIGLLMALIWSFHIQYGQPASFYLKAPTLLYVFIFIALRALRFEPLYVVAAGLAGAAGWIALLVYAAMSGEMAVTRNYVAYMTSNSVLVGAEVDKILSILLVTAVLALGLVRAQRILYRAVADSVIARDLSRFVSPEVAARITSAARELKPGDGEVRTASVLFTDIEGFSTIAERLQPERLISMLNAYFAAVSDAIDRHGGVITQYQGDAMLITFNTVKDDPDHAANAVRTALAIQEATRERSFGEGLRMRTRCGINTGRIVAGAVGTGERLLYTVHGDEVNVAARLEQLNKTTGTYVLATESTVQAAGRGFAFERVAEVTVRGRSQPTAVYTPRSAGTAAA
jgi:adenylate cyclase